MLNKESGFTDVKESGEWLRILSPKKKMAKAANVGAVSGEAGFVPMPPIYDGKPVDTTSKEKEILEIIKRDYEKIKLQVDEEMRRLFNENNKKRE